MKTALLTRTMQLCLVAILVSCETTTPVEPRDDVVPIVIAGDYNLVAPGATTSNAWETFDVGFEGTLSLEQDPTLRSRLSGTFQDVSSIGADGFPTDRKLHGTITGSIDSKGNVTLQLATQSGDLEWIGRGILADSQISGRWETRRWHYEAAGGFSARLASSR